MAMIRSALISYLLSLFCLFVFLSVASLHPDHRATYGASALNDHSYASEAYHDSKKAAQLTSNQASEILFSGSGRVLSHKIPIPLDADEESDPDADVRTPKQEVEVTRSSSRRTLSQEVGNPATLSAGEAQDGKTNSTAQDGKHDRDATKTGQANQTSAKEHQPAPAFAPTVNPARSNKTDTKERKDASEGPVNKDETRKKTNSSTEPMQQCEDSYCEDPPKVITACLQMSGDGVHKFSLSITNGGGKDVNVTVITPMFLKAEQAKLLVKNRTSETVLIGPTDKTALDSDKAQNMNITVRSIHGECSIRVPVLEDFRDTPSLKFSQYFVYLTPTVGVYILLGLLAIVCGVTLFCKYRRKKRAGGSVKYQQLEMNATVVGTPKEREQETVDGWDEMWDDDWEDTEAARSSSRLTQNLSSRGLATRRGNKDGWDD